jgi:hypothetical protein
MTNREHLNRCSDKALVKFLLSQGDCRGCVLRKTCEASIYSPAYNPKRPPGKCADRLLVWLQSEAEK